MKRIKLDIQECLSLLNIVKRKIKLLTNRRLAHSYVLRTYDCDRYGNIRMISLMNFLQDVTQRHLAKFNYAKEFLAQQKAWVVSKYDIKILRYPKMYEKITILTWISEVKSISTIREFKVVNKSGEVLIEVVSKWALIDMVNKKTMEMPSLPLCKKKLFTTKFAQLKLNSESPTQERIERTVGYDDIDFNQNLNNGYYISWASEAVEKGFRLEHAPREVIVCFKKDAHYLDKITIETNQEESKTLHVIKNNDNICANVTIFWGNKENALNC